MSMLVVGGLYQLSPVNGRSIYAASTRLWSSYKLFQR